MTHRDWTWRKLRRWLQLYAHAWRGDNDREAEAAADEAMRKEGTDGTDPQGR